jgi:hypothetical protein
VIAGGVAGLTLVVLGLSGTIALELADRHRQQAASPTLNTIRAEAAAASLAMPSQTDIDARMNEILIRPVFNPGRRPISSAARNVTGPTRLTGIVITKSAKIAIFAASSDGHPFIVEEGSRISAYEVKNISDSGVTVVGPAGVLVVTPHFDVAHPPVPRQSPPGPPRPARTTKE